LNPTWHAEDIDEVTKNLKSQANGLTAEQVEQRLREYGYNELKERKKVTALQIFLAQFKNIFVVMLLIAIAISAVLGWYEAQALRAGGSALEAYVDAIAIGAIVVLNAAVGFVQEFRSEKAMEALAKLTTPKARVLRDGKDVQVQAREIVSGDILLLESGDRVAADARLMETVDLNIDEAVLTGESTSVTKNTAALAEETAVADRKNMVFAGTHVLQGRGRAIVTATGIETQFGRISEMVQTVEKEEIPLKLKLDRFAKKIGVIVIIAAVTIVVFSLVRSGTIEIDLLLTSVALAVSAVPEGLPAVVTVTLALGARELSKRNAVVRRLASVETLGSTTVICSDKTGTLTKGEMTVRKLYLNSKVIEVTGTGYESKGELQQNGKTIQALENDDVSLLLRIGLLCNNASYDGFTVLGDPTEGALKVAAHKGEISPDEVEKQYPRIAEIPFSSERMLMTTIHNMPEGQQVAYVKGSPEKVLQLSNRIFAGGEEKKLNEALKTGILSQNEDIASRGLRVLGMAYKTLSGQKSAYMEESVERNLVFVGLVGMIDPPREEAKEAVRLCKQGQIKVVMITGDHKLTAVTVAKELGILKDGLALTGEELDRKSSEEFEKIVENVRVYARVSPEHKMRIVQTLKKNGNVVAMTGDGVNDAPAVKQADIGVAMGVTGTDVRAEG
jgi:Ca2+-transporting ATPase